MENVIFSAGLLFVGCVFSWSILFFGVKFCKDDEHLTSDATWKRILWQVVKGQPFWMYLLAFLVFQPAIVHILNTWIPSIWNSSNWISWIPKLSDFIALTTLVLFVVIFNITDDYGKLKLFKKS